MLNREQIPKKIAHNRLWQNDLEYIPIFKKLENFQRKIRKQEVFPYRKLDGSGKICSKGNICHLHLHTN